MKKDIYFWDYFKQPGITVRQEYVINKNEYKPLVSIITSYYNSQEYMWQTINCVLNQTFPFWEWIIVDDGSNDADAIRYLGEIQKIDFRIKVFHKENEGLAKGRDYAVKQSSTEYILPLDADDLIEPTYIESLYLCLKTNPDATWAFTNSVGFGKYIYLSDCKFNSEIMKAQNQITATALIKKDKITGLGGYGIAKRYVNEDWHLWLRMLADECFPIQVDFYGFWYRRKNESLLTSINDEAKKENELRLRDLKIEADKITKTVKAKIYPEDDKSKITYNELLMDYDKINIKKPGSIYVVDTIGYDKKFINLIKEKSLNEIIYIVTIGKTQKSKYCMRQNIEKYATVFDLTAFLDRKYYLGFIKYLMNTRNIKQISISKSIDEKEILKNNISDIDEIDYNTSNFKYSLEIIKYKIMHTIVFRAIRKLIKKKK